MKTTQVVAITGLALLLPSSAAAAAAASLEETSSPSSRAGSPNANVRSTLTTLPPPPSYPVGLVAVYATPAPTPTEVSFIKVADSTPPINETTATVVGEQQGKTADAEEKEATGIEVEEVKATGKRKQCEEDMAAAAKVEPPVMKEKAGVILAPPVTRDRPVMTTPPQSRSTPPPRALHHHHYGWGGGSYYYNSMFYPGSFAMMPYMMAPYDPLMEGPGWGIPPPLMMQAFLGFFI